MFSDFDAGACQDECGGGADVESGLLIAPGATSIEQRPRIRQGGHSLSESLCSYSQHRASHRQRCLVLEKQHAFFVRHGTINELNKLCFKHRAPLS